MRNLICLGRKRTYIRSQDLPVTGVAPIPSSENAFFVANGPSAINCNIEFARIEAHSLVNTSDKFRMRFLFKL